jgi:hypothetical protein
MDEKLNTTSRWLLALAVILIPLTAIALVSGAWGVNYQFDTNQWIRYLIFASWILLAISAVTGIANLINPPELESEKAVTPAPAGGSLEVEDDEDGEDTSSTDKEKVKPAFNAAYAFTLAQACSFALGLILYVAYMSWMILGLQAYPTGF